MRFKTAWSAKAEASIKSLAADPRRALHLAVKSLAKGRPRADIRALEGRLQGCLRWRAGTHRIIYAPAVEKDVPRLNFLFSGPRPTVYEAFEKTLADELSG